MSKKKSKLEIAARLMAAYLYPLQGLCEDCGQVPVLCRHHKNGELLDMRPENIALLCRPCHDAVHVAQRRREPRRCADCMRVIPFGRGRRCETCKRRVQRARAHWATYGGCLRALRARRLLSQRELADLVGVHQSTVSAWELGTRAPQPEHYRRLCDALRVEPADLLESAAEVEAS